MSDNPTQLAGQAVFLSASIPDPSRWPGEFDALEITDAVVSVARAVLSAGAVLVTAAHPTIAPLILYVAAELPDLARRQVVVYQSAVFDDVLPAATRRFEAEGIGEFVRTPAVGNEPADPVRAPASLAAMRRQMFSDTQPTAGVFIGGMGGIPAEHALFSELLPGKPTYAFGYPGGAARTLALSSRAPLSDLMRSGTIYPTLARALIEDVVRSQ